MSTIYLKSWSFWRKSVELKLTIPCRVWGHPVDRGLDFQRRDFLSSKIHLLSRTRRILRHVWGVEHWDFQLSFQHRSHPSICLTPERSLRGKPQSIELCSVVHWSWNSSIFWQVRWWQPFRVGDSSSHACELHMPWPCRPHRLLRWRGQSYLPAYLSKLSWYQWWILTI